MCENVVGKKESTRHTEIEYLSRQQSTGGFSWWVFHCRKSLRPGSWINYPSCSKNLAGSFRTFSTSARIGLSVIRRGRGPLTGKSLAATHSWEKVERHFATKDDRRTKKRS